MPGQEGAPQGAVRRAMVLPGMSGGAGEAAALTPRAPAAGPGGPEVQGGVETEGGPDPVTTTPAPLPVTATARAPRSTAEPDGESRTATPMAGAATATVAEGADAGAEPPAAAASAAAAGPPSGRPSKPLLAAAAIGGSLLIGIPLLFMNTGDDRARTQVTASSRTSSDMLLRDEDAGLRAPGAYAPASPAASPKPKKSAEAYTAAGTRHPAVPAGPPPSAKVSEQSRNRPVSSADKMKKPTAAPTTVRRTQAVRAGGALPTGANFNTVTGVLIRNRMTGLCVDVPYFGKGTLNGRVEQFTCEGSDSDNQQWDLVVNQEGAGPGGADLFTIRNEKDDYCLDLPDFGAKPAGTRVYEWHCNPGGGDNQMWFLDQRANGSFWIRNHRSAGLCLDVDGLGGSGGRAADLTVFGCSAQDDHAWSFS